MTSRNYAWKKRILIPFWVLRGFIVIIFVIAFGAFIHLCLVDDSENPGYCDKTNQARARLLPSMIAFYFFLIFVLLLDVLQIYLFIRNQLKPLIFLILNAMQCVFWLGNFFADVAYLARHRADGATVGVVAFILALYLPLLIYASIGYHRQRKQQRLGAYSLTYNPAQEAQRELPIYQGPGASVRSTPPASFSAGKTGNTV